MGGTRPKKTRKKGGKDQGAPRGISKGSAGDGPKLPGLGKAGGAPLIFSFAAGGDSTPLTLPLCWADSSPLKPVTICLPTSQ